MRIAEHMKIFKDVWKRNESPKNKATLNLRNAMAEIMNYSVK